MKNGAAFSVVLAPGGTVMFWVTQAGCDRAIHVKETRQIMRKLTAALCALALFAPAAQAQTIKDFLAAVMVKWTAPFEPFQLIGNIYYVGTDGIAVYIIKTSQGLILMDTAMPQSTGMI